MTKKRSTLPPIGKEVNARTSLSDNNDIFITPTPKRSTLSGGSTQQRTPTSVTSGFQQSPVTATLRPTASTGSKVGVGYQQPRRATAPAKYDMDFEPERPQTPNLKEPPPPPPGTLPGLQYQRRVSAPVSYDPKWDPSPKYVGANQDDTSSIKTTPRAPVTTTANIIGYVHIPTKSNVSARPSQSRQRGSTAYDSVNYDWEDTSGSNPNMASHERPSPSDAPHYELGKRPSTSHGTRRGIDLLDAQSTDSRMRPVSAMRHTSTTGWTAEPAAHPGAPSHGQLRHQSSSATEDSRTAESDITSTTGDRVLPLHLLKSQTSPHVPASRYGKVGSDAQGILPTVKPEEVMAQSHFHSPRQPAFSKSPKMPATYQQQHQESEF